MISHLQQGPGRGSYIGGKIVHNQRVERLWRDVFYGVTGLYYELFHYLEEIGELCVNNENHIWALQYTFVPRINHALKSLQMAGTPIHFPVRETDLRNSFGY